MKKSAMLKEMYFLGVIFAYHHTTSVLLRSKYATFKSFSFIKALKFEKSTLVKGSKLF